MTTKATLAPNNIRDLFIDAGALLEGHFLLSSGLHSAQYMQCALLLAHPSLAARLGKALAAVQKEKPDLVLSPAMGGLIIGQEVARALDLRHYFTERQDGVMTLRRGFSLKTGEKIVVVEDVVTTGKSSKEVMDLSRAMGAEIVGWLSIVNRSGADLALDVPLKSLLKTTIPSFRPEDCPQCKEGRPFVKPGSRSGKD
ncbi:MAG: orotate phosphoribosyltransferase [Elusimicrobia bacterium]|nr:orotate phosphoribosyltransferase [Elusimicrobiota bacterium]